jgi:serine/threonine protein phosphatase PrpC
LIKRANRAGGYDNITVVVVEYSEDDLVPQDKESMAQKAGEYGVVFSYPENKNSPD